MTTCTTQDIPILCINVLSCWTVPNVGANVFWYY